MCYRFVLGAILLGGGTALAHEFWLEALRFRVAPGQTVLVRPLVGEHFHGEPWSKQAARIRRFVRYGPIPTDSTDLTPAPGFAPTDTFSTAVTFARAGTHVVVLHSTDSFIELPAEQFSAYLREEGLDNVLRLRQEQNQQARPGREAYRRCAKILIHAGDPAAHPAATDSAYRHVYALPLELVPDQNPYRLAPGQALTVRVLRAGRPAPGALVQVWQRQPDGQPVTHFTTRTNQNGRVLLRLSDSGPYLLTAVLMIGAPANLRDRAEWQSTWASLTFAGPPAPSQRFRPKY